MCLGDGFLASFPCPVVPRPLLSFLSLAVWLCNRNPGLCDQVFTRVSNCMSLATEHALGRQTFLDLGMIPALAKLVSPVFTSLGYY